MMCSLQHSDLSFFILAIIVSILVYFICNSGILCEEDINDCDPDPCYHGSQCVDGVDDYTCQCVSGYEGTACFMENETLKKCIYPLNYHGNLRYILF